MSEDFRIPPKAAQPLPTFDSTRDFSGKAAGDHRELKCTARSTSYPGNTSISVRDSVRHRCKYWGKKARGSADIHPGLVPGSGLLKGEEHGGSSVCGGSAWRRPTTVNGRLHIGTGTANPNSLGQSGRRTTTPTCSRSSMSCRSSSPPPDRAARLPPAGIPDSSASSSANANCRMETGSKSSTGSRARRRSRFLIVTSRLADASLWAEVLNLGGYDLLAKPFNRQEVRHVLTSAWVQRANPVRARRCRGSAPRNLPRGYAARWPRCMLVESFVVARPKFAQEALECRGWTPG